MSYVTQGNVALFTDEYELRMAQAYFQNEMNVLATFELFVRELPPNRGYLLTAGLEQVCEHLQGFGFDEDLIEWLAGKGFSDDFLSFLSRLRFSGDVWAMPEGSLLFQKEPVLRVTAPIIEGQLLETFVINTIHFQTLIASKAARVVQAAEGRPVVDFGSRRAHGLDAGIKAARACYVAGCAGTSNMLAGKLYGIPTYGTMAHSFIEIYPSELDAFRDFLRVWGGRVLLIDTYDTLKGARNAIRLGLELQRAGKRLEGVRIDAGDLLGLSKQVRSMLDQAGLRSVRIFASGGLDEYEISELLRRGARIDAFGVGTKLVTSKDQAALEFVYKLMESEEEGRLKPRMKIAEEEKLTHPGAKQVFRKEKDGSYVGDVVGLADERLEGSPQLLRIFRKGKLVYKLPKLERIRERAMAELRKLPERHKRLRNPAPYPVRISPALKRLTQELRKAISTS
jgi:nicotinate phosphoribosyltransferase